MINNTVEKLLNYILLTASVLLIIWLLIISNSGGESVGTINKIYEEGGYTKIDFVSEEGEKQTFVYQGDKKISKGDDVKLKFFKLLFAQPKITYLEKKND
jgi:hypothetical protein